MWHMWRRIDIDLPIEGHANKAVVKSVLLYGSQTWPLRVTDIRNLSVFEHCCLPSIGWIWWENFVSNAEFRRKILTRSKDPVS